MPKAIAEALKGRNFIGPPAARRWDKPDQPPQKLLSRDFILLFLMAMCSNSFIAVYYCFEQWMEGLGIDPHWRGILLSALFAMILLFRPIASIVMLKHGKLWVMLISLAVCTAVMIAYPYVPQDGAIALILILRLLQGIALAFYSACTIGVLVECIPPGQSARGFALFSLTMLLPYSIIPAISEKLLPILGGEGQLFGATAWLSLPSFIMVILLAKRLKKPEAVEQGNPGISRGELKHAVLHSGLAFVYCACLAFSMTTVLAIFFMKGLCGLTGDHPAWFFTTYSITIILVRIFGSHRMDTLPRYRVSIICAAVLAICMAGFAWAPQWTFIPLALIYGLSLGLLYPLLAAAVYDRSTPDTRSINSNVMMATFDASGMLAPMLGGVVIAWGFGYRGVFSAGAITAAFCGAFMLLDRARVKMMEKRNA